MRGSLVAPPFFAPCSATSSLGPTRMKRFFRIVWGMWLAGTIIWAVLVLIYMDNRPTFSDLRLLVTTRDPPLSDFLTSPDAECDLLPVEAFAEHMLEEVGDHSGMPILDLDGVVGADRDAARDAWQRDMEAYAFDRRLDISPLDAWLCEDGPFVDAVLARHADTRPRRAAKARLSGFLWPFLMPPVGLLFLGLFLLWSPFRRHT